MEASNRVVFELDEEMFALITNVRLLLVRPMKLLFWIIAVLLGLPALILVMWFAVLFIMERGNPDFLKIDRCADSGGKWSYSTRTCEH